MTWINGIPILDLELVTRGLQSHQDELGVTPKLIRVKQHLLLTLIVLRLTGSAGGSHMGSLTAAVMWLSLLHSLLG
jgi:hypothetical protein